MLVVVGWWKKLGEKRNEESYILPHYSFVCTSFLLWERESVSSKVACLWKQYIHNCKIIDLETKPLVYQAHHFYLHLCHNMKEIYI